MQWVLDNETQKFVSVFVGAAACFLLIYTLCLWSQWNRLAINFNETIQIATTISFAIMNCAIWVFFTQLFANMKTREGRIRYIMLPASNLEKYLARFILVFVALPVTMFVAFLIADALVSLVTLFLPIPYVMSGFRAIREMCLVTIIDFDGTHIYFDSYAGMGFGMMMNAMVWFCATLFRRPLVMSIICVISFMTLFILSLVTLAEAGYLRNIPDTTSNVQMVIFGTICWILFALLIWGSYRIFCRMQVITNKWINI